MSKNKRGSALLLTTILLFVVLSLVVSLSYVTVMEQQMSSKTKSSVGSFFNADSGVEWALNKIANATGGTIAGVFGAINFNPDGSTYPFANAGYKVYLLDSEGKVITDLSKDISLVKAVRSVGTQTAGDPTQRAIEAAVAETGIGKYQISCSLSGALTMCCRVDTETGSTECKMTPDHPNPWITFGNKPW